MPSLVASTAGFWRWRENPRPAGCKKLKGHKDQWRIRIGDWRVVYFIDDSAGRVSIARVAHCREVYDG
jgi:mRNA interferase RelE/StbE